MNRTHSIKILSLPFIFIISVILLVSCGKENEQSETDLELKVDTTKYGKFINDNEYGIAFYAPNGWQMMKSEMSEKNESLINKRKAKERYLYKPKYVFFNDSTRCFLSVGDVIDSSKDGKEESPITGYSEMLISKFKENNYTFDEVEFNGIPAQQLIITMPKITSYKIFFSNNSNRLFQFEYTVPNEFLSDEKIAISSSISSIQLR